MSRKISWLVGGLECAVVLWLLLTGSTDSQPSSEQRPIARPLAPPDDGKLRILCFGAHPDDCELRAGGVAVMWAAKGPKKQAERRRQIRAGHANRSQAIAQRFRNKLTDWYGKAKAEKVGYAEAFEICEYGRRPNKKELARLFPFFGE